MQPAIISGHNRRFTAPAGLDEVQTLFARIEEVGGVHFLTSAWDVEQGEIGLLLAGAKLHLGINAPAHPIVRLAVADLPNLFSPVMTARRIECPDKGSILRVEAILSAPPLGQRIWVERPIVDGFAAAFASAIEAIEEQASARGLTL